MLICLTSRRIPSHTLSRRILRLGSSSQSFKIIQNNLNQRTVQKNLKNLSKPIHSSNIQITRRNLIRQPKKICKMPGKMKPASFMTLNRKTWNGWRKRWIRNNLKKLKTNSLSNTNKKTLMKTIKRIILHLKKLRIRGKQTLSFKESSTSRRRRKKMAKDKNLRRVVFINLMSDKMTLLTQLLRLNQSQTLRKIWMVMTSATKQRI